MVPVNCQAPPPLLMTETVPPVAPSARGPPMALGPVFDPLNVRVTGVLAIPVTPVALNTCVPDELFAQVCEAPSTKLKLPLVEPTVPIAPDISLTVMPPLPTVSVFVVVFCCKTAPLELLKMTPKTVSLLPNLQVVPVLKTLLALNAM